MLDIEKDIFRDIIREFPKVGLSYDGFERQHQFITSATLRNYANGKTSPSEKRYRYVLNCLKQDHNLMFRIMVSNIEQNRGKNIEDMIKDSLYDANKDGIAIYKVL